MRMLLSHTSILLTTASGRNMTRSQAEIAFYVDWIKTLRQHVVFFCAAETTSTQCEATVVFIPSPIVGRAIILRLCRLCRCRSATLGRRFRSRVPMCRGSGCLARLLEALDFHVECRQGGVLDRPKFSLKGSICGADLEHYADEVIDPDVRSIRFVDEGQEFIAELYD